MINPNILWAQDKEFIFLKINIINICEQNIEFKKDSIIIRGRNEKDNFNIELNFTFNIISDLSNWNLNSRHLLVNLKKEKSVFINKLTKHKMNNIKIDWSKWTCDDSSDEENEKEDLLNNFNEFKKSLPEEILNKDLSEFDNSLDELIDNGNDASCELSNSIDENDLLINNDIKFTPSSLQSLDIEELKDDIEEVVDNN